MTKRITSIVLGATAALFITAGGGSYMLAQTKTPEQTKFTPPHAEAFTPQQPGPYVRTKEDEAAYQRIINDPEVRAARNAEPVNIAPNPARICAHFDATKLLADKCDYSSWNKTITITMNVTTAEARQCEPIVTAMRGLGLDGWTLRITTPYSGDKSIAMCDLES